MTSISGSWHCCNIRGTTESVGEMWTAHQIIGKELWLKAQLVTIQKLPRGEKL